MVALALLLQSLSTHSPLRDPGFASLARHGRRIRRRGQGGGPGVGEEVMAGRQSERADGRGGGASRWALRRPPGYAPHTAREAQVHQQAGGGVKGGASRRVRRTRAGMKGQEGVGDERKQFVGMLRRFVGVQQRLCFLYHLQSTTTTQQFTQFARTRPLSKTAC